MRYSLGVAPYPTREMQDDPTFDPNTYWEDWSKDDQTPKAPTPFDLNAWVSKHQSAIIVGGVALFGFALLTASGGRRR